MPARPLRLGIIGGGYGAYGIAAACRRSGAFVPAAIATRNRTKAVAIATRYAIARALDDARGLIESADIDAIAIAVPPEAQKDLVLAAFAAGKPVFAEKPLAIGLADAQRLHAAAGTLPAMVDFLFPEIAAWRETETLLAGGAIGALRHVVVDWRTESHDVRNRISSWKTDPTRGGGALAHMASHVLHYLERYCGSGQRMQALLSAAPDIPGTETFAALSLAFASGASAAISVSIAMPLESSHSVSFYGSEGCLLLSQRGADPVDFSLARGDRANRTTQPVACAQPDPPLATGEDPRAVPVARLLGRFARWITLGEPAAPGFAHGLRAQLLIDAARRSSGGAGIVLV